MKKLMTTAAVLALTLVGCGAPESTSSGETEEALTRNGLCYSQSTQCKENCDPSDDLCNCNCHNQLSLCLVPHGILYKCPPDTAGSAYKGVEPGEPEAPAPAN